MGRAPAQGRAEQHQLFDLIRDRARELRLVGDQRVGCSLEPRKIQRAVEPAPRSGRLDVQAESERSGAVVRPLRQVVEFGEPRETGIALDHASSPEVRHGIPDGAEEALQACRLVDFAGEAKLDRIELDSIGTLPVGAPVHEPADRPRTVVGPPEAACGHELRFAGRHDVDEALALRSHRSTTCEDRAVRGLRACSRVLPSSSRSGSATSRMWPSRPSAHSAPM